MLPRIIRLKDVPKYLGMLEHAITQLERENAKLRGLLSRAFPPGQTIPQWIDAPHYDALAARVKALEGELIEARGENERLNDALGRLLRDLEAARRERDAARSNAKILAHACMTDNRPPENVVRDSLNYPTTPQAPNSERCGACNRGDHANCSAFCSCPCQAPQAGEEWI